MQGKNYENCDILCKTNHECSEELKHVHNPVCDLAVEEAMTGFKEHLYLK
jgi:hypothetical protein